MASGSSIMWLLNSPLKGIPIYVNDRVSNASHLIQIAKKKLLKKLLRNLFYILYKINALHTIISTLNRFLCLSILSYVGWATLYCSGNFIIPSINSSEKKNQSFITKLFDFMFIIANSDFEFYV